MEVGDVVDWLGESLYVMQIVGTYIDSDTMQMGVGMAVFSGVPNHGNTVYIQC
jgi:hypothetical protein